MKPPQEIANTLFKKPHPDVTPTTGERYQKLANLEAIYKQIGCMRGIQHCRDTEVKELVSVSNKLLAEFDDETVLMNTPIAYHRHFEALRELLKNYPNP